MRKLLYQAFGISVAAHLFASQISWSESDTVVLNCGDTFDPTGEGVTKPLRTLVAALKSKPKAQKFRLIWWQVASSTSEQSTALYDRRSKTLSYFRRTESSGLGYEGFSNQFNRYVLEGVNDAMLRQLNQKYPHPMSDPGDSYFSKLVLLGAKRQPTLDSRSR